MKVLAISGVSGHLESDVSLFHLFIHTPVAEAVDIDLKWSFWTL
jgi:hypothetical protein